MKPQCEQYFIPSEKSKEFSNFIRSEGNKFYKELRFFEALECYNQSLSFAEAKSSEIPLAYANRSALYLEVKEYQLCLDNIQLAIDSNYPVDKLQTLKTRKDKCKTLIETDVKSDDYDPWKFFKLSYPANEKIPFIVDCLELRRNEKFGRYIVTNRG
jgi:SET and MYND domain-containing protein 4